MEIFIVQNTENKKTRQVIKGEPLNLQTNETVVGSVFPSTASKLAVLATRNGLPVPEFLDVARWLLKKKCPYCQLSTEILKLTVKLGENETQSFIERLLVAKRENDLDTLQRVADEVNELIQRCESNT